MNRQITMFNEFSLSKLNNSLFRSTLSIILVFIPTIASFLVNNKIGVSYCAVFQLISIVFAYKVSRKRYSSFSFIFLLVLFLFHSGYSILWVFNYEFTFNSYQISLLSDEVWIKTLRFSTMFIFLCFMGIIAFNPKLKAINDCKMISLQQCKNIGWIMLILFVFPRIYIDYIYLNAGYLNQSSVEVNGFVEIFARGFYIGLIFLLIGYKNNKKAQFLAFSLGLVFCLIGMLSGKRQEKLVFFIALAIVFISRPKEKRTMSITSFFLILFAYVLLAFVATVGDVRKSYGVSFDNFSYVFINNLGYKMLFGQIEEFAYASYTLGVTINCFSTTGTGHGLSYITTWLQVLPNIGGVLNSINRTSVYAYEIPRQFYYWLGGSIMGEAYYNFGYLSLLFVIPFGMIIEYVSCSLINATHYGIIKRSSVFCIVSIGLLLLWVRGYIADIPRSLIWLSLFVLIFKNITIISERY